MNERIFVLGGTGNSAQIDFADVLPDAGVTEWVRSPTSLPSLLRGHTAVLHGPRLFVLGGSEVTTLSARILVSTITPTGSLTPFERNPVDLPFPMSGHASVVIGDQLLLIGGYAQTPSAYARIASVYLADFTSDGGVGAWRALSALPAGRSEHDVAVIGDTVFCAGGTDSADAGVADLFAATFSSSTLSAWRSVGSLNGPLWNHQLVSVDDRLHLFGGNGPVGPQFTVQTSSLDDAGVLSSWSFGTPMMFPRGSPSVVRLGARLFVISGRVPGPLEAPALDVEVFGIEPTGALRRLP